MSLQFISDFFGTRKGFLLSVSAVSAQPGMHFILWAILTCLSEIPTQWYLWLDRKMFTLTPPEAGTPQGRHPLLYHTTLYYTIQYHATTIPSPLYHHLYTISCSIPLPFSCGQKNMCNIITFPHTFYAVSNEASNWTKTTNCSL